MEREAESMANRFKEQWNEMSGSFNKTEYTVSAEKEYKTLGFVMTKKLRVGSPSKKGPSPKRHGAMPRHRIFSFPSLERRMSLTSPA